MVKLIDKWTDEDGEHTIEQLDHLHGYYLFCDERLMTWIQMPNGETIPEAGFYKSIAVGRQVFGRVAR